MDGADTLELLYPNALQMFLLLIHIIALPKSPRCFISSKYLNVQMCDASHLLLIRVYNQNKREDLRKHLKVDVPSLHKLLSYRSDLVDQATFS
jgi:hypothetical protein